jgi:hypothetical protein
MLGSNDFKYHLNPLRMKAREYMTMKTRYEE